MKEGLQNVMKPVSVYVDWMQMFVIISTVGIMIYHLNIHVDVNVKNSLIKVHAIKDMLRIQVIVNMNVTIHVILVSI